MARLFLAPLEDRVTPATTLLADTNPTVYPDFQMATVGSHVVFLRATAETGLEVWHTDGTEAGTRLLRDFVPGPATSSPYFVQTVGDQLYLVTTSADMTHLWRTDGTDAGTVLLRSFKQSGGNYPSVGESISFNGKLYFAVGQNYRPEQLWCTDGTAQGTTLIRTIGWNYGDFDDSPAAISRMTVVGNRLYFTAQDRTHGEALWVSNGTASGTKPVSNNAFATTEYDPEFDESFLVEYRNIHPTSLIAFNDQLYFYGRAFGYGTRQLWRTDGTEAGTELVKNIRQSANAEISSLTVVGTKLFFVANNGTTGSAQGRELWTSDGTTAGTVLVKDIAPGTTSGLLASAPFRALNGKLYFVANNGTNGRELWMSDGTTAGTTMVRDLQPGNVTTGFSGGLAVLFGKLYFTAVGPSGLDTYESDGTFAGTVPAAVDLAVRGTFLNGDWYWQQITNDVPELYRTNGTAVGTTRLAAMTDYPTSSMDFAWNADASFQALGLTFFTTQNGLWRTDGTPAGTIRLTTQAVTGQLVLYNGYVYFNGNDPSTGNELWRTNGSLVGTSLVKDIFTGTTAFGSPNSSSPSQLTVFQGKLYFAATSSMGTELWVSDGTSANTLLLKDIDAGTPSSSPNYFTVFNGRLYFTAYEATAGNEWWSTDGTANGTARVIDLLPNNPSSNPQSFTQHHGRLYFNSTSASGGTAFWSSDGTAAGTIRLEGVALDTSFTSMPATHRLAFGSNVYFVVDEFNISTDRSTLSIWRTDGTTATRLTTARPNYNALTSRLVPLGDTLYYLDGTGSSRALRRIDTASGTITLVKTLALPSWAAKLDDVLFVQNGRLYFVGNDAKQGVEWWSSDGTTSNTRPWLDVRPGKASSFDARAINGSGDPEYAVWVPNVYQTTAGFYFNASSDDQLPKTWFSDGTADGTVRVAAGETYRHFSTPSGIDMLAFSDGRYGIEPFAYTPLEAQADSYTLENGPYLEVSAANGVLANDTDGPQPATGATLVAPPQHGWLTLRADGSFRYQPFDRDFTGTDAFTYRAQGTVATSPVTAVTLTVDPTNQPPTPENDAVTGRLGKAATIDVLANDTDPDHDSLALVSFTQGSGGRVLKVGTKLRYIPNRGTTTDTFTYTIRDPRTTNEAEYATATVTVTLLPTAVPKLKSVRVYPGTGTGFVDVLKSKRKTLPFDALQRIELTFTGAVTIAADDLRIRGTIGGAYTLTDFTYNPTTFTASWLIQTPVAGRGADRLTILLDGSSTGATDALNNPLGDWTRSTMLLAGDYNGDGIVNARDFTPLMKWAGLTAVGKRFFADVDGNGIIDQNDLTLATTNPHRLW